MKKNSTPSAMLKIFIHGFMLAVFVFFNVPIVSGQDTDPPVSLPPVYVTYPADSAVNRKTKLDITAKAIMASVYTIEISPDVNFSSGVISKSGGRTQTFENLQYGTTYYARVKTNLNPNYGKRTMFSTIAAEDLAYIIDPMPGAVNRKTVLSITSNPVQGAIQYTIELNTSPEFNGTSIVQTGGKTQSFSGLSYNTTYYSRVRTEFTEIWGATRSFTTVAAEDIAYIITPADGAVNQKLMLSITTSSVPGASEYTIELNTAQNFSGTSIVQTGGRVQNFTGLSYSTTYYTRVRTELTENWGPTRTFTTVSPASLSYVITPKENAVNQKVNLNIYVNNVTGAASYTVQLSESQNFSAIAFTQTSELKTFTFSGLKYNTTYYSRVRTNLSGDFGATRSFTTTSPVLLSYVAVPANNAVNVKTSNLSVTSNTVPGATTYTIQLSETANFSNIDFEMTGPTAALVFSGLKYNTTYYNRVRTNLSGVFGQTGSFTTRTPESISYVYSPADGAMDRPTSLYVVSSNVPGASMYTIQLSEQSNFSSIAFELSGPTPSLRFTGLSEGTLYYSRVITNLTSNYGATKTFTTRVTIAGRMAGSDDVEDSESSIEESEIENTGMFEVTAYPNPFKQRTSIFIEGPAGKKAKVVLRNIYGGLVHESVEPTNSTVEVGNELSVGIYLVEVSAGVNRKLIRIVKSD